MMNLSKMRKNELIEYIGQLLEELNVAKEEQSKTEIILNTIEVELQELTSLNNNYARMIFESSAHILSTKEPSEKALKYVNQVFTVLTEKIFPNKKFEEQQESHKLHEKEQQDALEETRKSRGVVR